jgi:uncharacterized protein with NAD-binding domain and iron-sulfur cluster
MPEKIAILGGGLGSLITALELTAPGSPNEGKYDLTVYQIGWRLGGKGASGRNGAHGERIEEHGLHVWLGFYENAFRLMRGAMTEWDIPDTHPWAAANKSDRWLNAFIPHSFAPLTESRDGKWEVWPIRFPEKNNGLPGDGNNPVQDFWGLVHELVRTLLKLGSTDHVELGGSGAPTEHVNSGSVTLMDKIERWLGDRDTRPGWIRLLTSPLRALAFFQAYRTAGVLRDLVLDSRGAGHRWSLYRLGIILNLGWALVQGLLWNSLSIARYTLDVLDKEDMRDFLRRYGAREVAVNSPILAGLYDGLFAYEDGEANRPRLAAGAGIRCLLRIFLRYKKALTWEMQAGMGDTVFTPFYDVLKARGVKFKFFHRVKKLELTTDKKSVARIIVGRQVTLKKPAAEYAPLRTVKGMNCWPSEVLWAQIDDAEAAQIHAEGINLEHGDNAWPDREEIILEAGKNFDRVLFGISIGALPVVAAELVAASSKLQKMVLKVKTTRTEAYQTWLKPDLRGLGWDQDPPILSGYLDPLNTWSDMSHLLVRENVDPAVHNISYFCGQMPDSVPVAAAAAHVRQSADALLNELSRSLWPLTEKNGVFDKSLIHMDYLRTNTNLSDRYVLTLPGATKARLRPDESGFENVTLTGDWTRNGLNVGCVEATVMSGMLASSAISGYPLREDIIGADGP